MRRAGRDLLDDIPRRRRRSRHHAAGRHAPRRLRRPRGRRRRRARRPARARARRRRRHDAGGDRRVRPRSASTGGSSRRCASARAPRPASRPSTSWSPRRTRTPGPPGCARDLDDAADGDRWRARSPARSRRRIATLRPAVLKAGRGSVDSVSQNRRDPAGPFDDALRVLLFDSPDPRDGADRLDRELRLPPDRALSARTCRSRADYPGHAVAHGAEGARRRAGRSSSTAPAATSIRRGSSSATTRRERVGSIVGAEAARRLQELRPLGSAAQGLEHPLGRADRQARHVRRADRAAHPRR